MRRLLRLLREQRGHTVAEVTVTVLLVGLVGAVIMTSLTTAVRVAATAQDENASIQDLRTAVEVIERDLRAANPIDAIDPALPVSEYATKLRFSVYCSTPGINDCGTDNLRSVTYQLVDNRLERVQGATTKVLVGPSGPAGFAPAQQRSAVVNTAAQPVFRYFDKDGEELMTSGADAPPSTRFRDCVKHVEIHLVVLREAGTAKTVDLDTTGTLRNFNEVDGC